MGQKTMKGMSTLGTHMIRRREELGLSQSAAARATKIGYSTQIARTTWVKWEKGEAIPERFNFIRIETVLKWQPGSVASIQAGSEPTPIRDHSPPDGVEAMLDELGIDRRKWRRVDEATRQGLITAYRIAQERKTAEEPGEGRRA